MRAPDGRDFLALLLRQKGDAVEQRLDEWCCAAPHKAGGKRPPREVTTCVGPLWRWGVALWSGLHLALALDATALGGRLVVLTVSVVSGGGAIPVAWTILPANQPQAGRREWLRMLRQVRPASPTDWPVLGLADRGVGARWRFLRIVRLGGHPWRRINQGAKCRPAGPARWYGWRALVGSGGQRGRGRGTAFVSSERRLAWTLVAWGDVGYTEPWLLLTAWAPEGCEAAGDGWRGWGEQGVKCCKRGGWQWQYPQMTAPDRAARLWLAVAVATWWMMRVGSAWEVGPLPEGMALPDLRPWLGAMVATPGRPRRLRLWRRGWWWCLGCQIPTGGLPRPQRFVPAPWPAIPVEVLVVTFHQNTAECNEI